MVGGPVEQVVEEIDEAGVRPLQVLDRDDDRQVLGEAFEEHAPAGEQLLACEALRGGNPEQLGQAGEDELPVGRVGYPALEPGAEPFRHDLERVLLADLQARPDHLRQRPVADSLAVAEAVPRVPQHLAREPVDVLEELPRKTGLADAGHAGHEHEAGRAPLGRSVEELLYEPQLVVATGEGRLEHARALRPRRRRHDPSRPKEPDGLGLALEGVFARLAVGDGGRRGRPGGLVDIAATRRGGGLDARGRVHAVADHETLLGRLGRRRTAGHDPDACLQLGPLLASVGRHSRGELKAGAHSPLGVVLLRHRRSPDRHHRVADELLDDAAVTAHDGPGELEVTRQDLAYLLGIAPLGKGREADEVAEQHRDVAQLGRKPAGRANGLGRLLGRARCSAGFRRRARSRTRRRTSRPAGPRYRNSDRREPGHRRTPGNTCLPPCSRPRNPGSASPLLRSTEATTPQAGVHPRRRAQARALTAHRDEGQEPAGAEAPSARRAVS